MFNVSTEAPVYEASYQLIDIVTLELELVLLGGLVVLAFALIARKRKSR